MNAAQNSQRWAIDQRKKAAAAFAASVRRADEDRRDHITELQRLAGMMERLPAMAATRARVLEQIAALQSSFAAP